MSTKITSLDRQGTKHLATLTTDLLAKFAADHGLVVMYKGGAFADSSATLKFEFKVTEDDGKVDPLKTLEAKTFTQLASMYRIDPAALGKTFVTNGKEYRVIGLKGSGKHPIICEDTATGKQYMFTVAGIVIRFPLDKPLDMLQFAKEVCVPPMRGEA